MRHYHAPRGQCGGGRRSVRMPLPTMSRWRRRRGSRCLHSNFGCRCLLGGNRGCFGSRWGRNRCRLDWLGSRSSHNRYCVNFNLGCGRWSFSNRNCRCGWRYRVLYDHSYSGRRNCDGRTMCDYSACRSLGNYRVGWRACGNGWRNRRTNDDGRRGTRLGNNLARFRLGWRHGWRRDGDNRRRWTRRSLGGLRGRTPLRHTALPGLFFLFLFLGQDGLQHVAGLGNMR